MDAATTKLIYGTLSATSIGCVSNIFKINFVFELSAKKWNVSNRKLDLWKWKPAKVVIPAEIAELDVQNLKFGNLACDTMPESGGSACEKNTLIHIQSEMKRPKPGQNWRKYNTCIDS